MQGALIIFQLLTLLFCSTLIPTITSTSASTATDFVRTSCTSAAYPSVCFRSLSSYASSKLSPSKPRQLAHAALTVSATKAREASDYVSHISSPSSSSVNPGLSDSGLASRAGPALQDCARTMEDSAMRLRQAVSEMGRLGPAQSPGFELCMSNLKTWVSAALTDHSMCLSSLRQAGAAGGEVAEKVRKKVVEVSQITSNALSLINMIN